MKTTTKLTLGLLLCSLGAGCKFLVNQIVDYTETWSSGLPKSRGSLAGGAQSGEWTFFYESGKPRAKGTYQNDRQIGAWSYYYENGVLERSGSYDDTGKRTGEWVMHYPDQTPQARGSYVADFEDGLWRFYAPNGVLEREGQFAAGKLSGPWNYYWPNGKPKAMGMYHDSVRVGVWSVWDEQGQRGRQDFGGKAGIEVIAEAAADGTVLRTGVLQGGAPTGRWTSYHGNGKLKFCCALTTGVGGSVATGVAEVRDDQGNVLAAAPIDPKAPKLADVDAAALVADLVRPIDRTAVAKPVEELQAPSPVVEQAVAKIEAEPARVAAPMQPDLTVKQRQEMKSYVQEYLTGPAPGASLFDKYRPAGAPPKPEGHGERTDWYGKPLPFQKVRGVDGNEIDLAQYKGKKKVMIVVLRGFLGEVCCYCVAQTKALAQSRERLEQLGVEVLVIYPGPKENEASFEQAYKMTFNEGGPPYRVFYDQNLELVTSLGIQGDLASPSTLIVGEDGNIKFFYKGEHKADRPAAKKLLQVIEGLAK